jgi:hypothetical protein
MPDVSQFGEKIVTTVRTFVARSLAPIEARLDVLEQRVPEKGEKGDKGDQGERGAAGEAAAKIVTGKGPPSGNGKPGDLYLDVQTGDIYQF